MLETAVFNAPSALSAANSGAHRLELCTSYSAGGLTPSLSTLRSIRASLDDAGISIPINVMIRPRGGDFNYSAAEFGEMKRSVEVFVASGMVSGFVFGVLDECGRVDEARNRELVRAAAGLPCTFHRAIDGVGDLVGAVERVVECGFASILTSGGERTAWEGVEVVGQLQKRFGGRISLILGGGVRSGNVRELRLRSGVEWLHSAAITGEEEIVDEEEVRKMVALLGDA